MTDTGSPQAATHVAGPSRPASLVLPTICLVVLVLVPGCAEKADVIRMEQTFDRKVSDLDKREQELGEKIARAEERMDQAEERMEKQAKEAEQLVREARARGRQDIAEVREEDLPRIEGRLEETDHFLRSNREQMDNLQHRLENLTQLTLKQQAENQNQLASIEEQQEDQFASVQGEQTRLHEQLKQVEQHLREDMGKMVAHIEALGPALESLAQNVDARLEAQNRVIATTHEQTNARAEELKTLNDQVTKIAEALPEYKQALTELGDKLVQEDATIAALSMEVTSQNEAIRAKMNADMDTMTAHMRELNAKLDSDMGAARVHLGEVTKKVDQDAKVTAVHLEDVNKSVASVAAALKTMSDTFIGRADEQERRLNHTSTQLSEIDARIASLSQTQEVNLQLLAGLEAQERRLDQTVAHLAEVNTGVESVADAVKTMSAGVLERVDEQENRLRETSQSLAAVTVEVGALSAAVALLNDKKPTRVDIQSGGRAPRPAPTENGDSSVSMSASRPSSDASEPVDRDLLAQQARRRYERILSRFKDGDLDGAREGFVEYLDQYPASARAPNAQYWLGECYYGKQQYLQAIDAYNRVEINYPQSNKVPAALLKKGYAYQAMNDGIRARAALTRVVESYADSAEATKASARLKQIAALQLVE